MHPLMLAVISLVVFLTAGAASASQTAGAPITIDSAAQVKELAALKGHTGPVFSLAFSADSRLLISGGSGSDYTARLWNAVTGAEAALLEGHTAQIAAVGFNADGTSALTTSYDATIRLWDPASGALTETIDKTDQDESLSVSNLITYFSGDGSKLAYATDGSSGYVFDLASRAQIDISDVNPDLFASIGAMAISADGKVVALTDFDGAIHVIDVETAAETGLLQPTESVYYNLLALSPDATMLAAANFDTETIDLWDIKAGKLTAVLSGHAPNTDGMLGIYGLAFNPDGTMLASASYDLTIRLWDVAAGKELAVLQPEGTGPSAVAWSPDSTRLASADLDGTVHLWGITVS